MKHIKQLTTQLAIPLMAIALAGCDFSAPGEGEYWSDSYNWVNFNGTYKSASGGAVVQLPATTAGVTENVDETIGSLNSGLAYSGNLGHPSIIPGTLQISSVEWSLSDDRNGNLVDINNAGTLHADEPGMGTTISEATAYSGTLVHRPVVPGSLTINIAGCTFRDDGVGNLTTSSPGYLTSIGHITYNSGVWSVTLNVPVAAGNVINGGYQYSTSGVGAVGHISYASGAWSIDVQNAVAVANQGQPINGRYQYSMQGGGGGDVINVYTLALMQEGNLLSMTDSNGSQYSGRMGSLSTSSGGDAGTPISGDQAIAQYEMTGRNNLTGQDVKIVGTLQGTVVRSGLSYYLTNRTMSGTWMESNGTTLDIIGVSGQIAVNINTSTNGAAKVEM